METVIRIPGYEIKHRIGRGGMATVYLAVQESLHREVALKVMRPSLAADEDFKQRFLNEGRIIAQLTHPNIVTVFDIGTYDELFYLSMELLSGGTLKEKIQQVLPVEQALVIVKTLASALGYAHERGFVHRDIKPINVLFRTDGMAVLTDFGIAKALGKNTLVTATGLTFGSAGHMSPEQSLGKPVDRRSDLYSLGVVFWEMLTSHSPYEAEDAFALALKHATEPIPKLPPELARFQSILNKLLAKQPEARFDTAEQFVAALDNIIESGNSLPSASELQAAEEQDPDKTVVKPLDPDRTVVKPPDPDKTIVKPPEVGQPAAEEMRLSAERPIRASKGGSRGSKRRSRVPTVGLIVVIPLALVIAALYWNPNLVPKLTSWFSQPDQERRQAEPDRKAEEQRRQAELDRKAEEQRRQAELDRKVEEQRRQAELDRKAEEQRRQAELDRKAEEQRRQAELDRKAEEQRRQAELDRKAEEQRRQAELDRKAEEQRRQAELDRKAEVNELARLLAQARVQWRARKLIEPPGDNAFESYRRVLELAPDNSEAKDNLLKIGQLRLGIHYQRMAEQLMEAGDLEQSLAKIQEGLRLAPDYPGLLSLREAVQAKLAERTQGTEEQRRNREVEQLLARARTQWQAGKLIAPPGDNAFESYRRVLELAPNNSEAKDNLLKIGQLRLGVQYQREAEQLLREGDLAASLAKIEVGLKLSPGHAGLLELREQVRARLSTGQR